MIWYTPKTNWDPSENIEIADWQRIEDDTHWIADFYGITLQYKTWEHTDFPTSTELSRIEYNINVLLEETHSFQAKFNWNLLSEIESLLLALHRSVLELQLSVRRAGTFSAGQQIYIPLGGMT